MLPDLSRPWSKLTKYLNGEETQLPQQQSPLPPEHQSFAELSDGMTYYELFGTREDPIVVLIHGISTPSFIWNYQLKSLVRSGYQVLRYDLYGRGLSDRPRTRYTAELFNRQLEELLESLGKPRLYALGGLSLGGAIAVNFATLNPSRLEKLFLVAPAGLRQSMPWWYHTAMLPGVIELLEYGLGHWYWSRFGPANLTSDPNKQAEARHYIQEQLQYEGFHRAMISTLRHGPIYGLRKIYEKLGETDLPVQATWSRDDRVVPYEMSNVLKKAVPQVRLNTVKEGSHAVNFDQPKWVNPSILEFLGRPPEKNYLKS